MMVNETDLSIAWAVCLACTSRLLLSWIRTVPRGVTVTEYSCCKLVLSRLLL